MEQTGDRMKRSILYLALTAVAVACTSAHPHGRVVMKLDDRTAHVELPPGSVGAGDAVALVELRCPDKVVRRRHSPPDGCDTLVRGAGTVTKVLSDKYTVVEFPKGLSFKEGDVVHPYPEGKPR